MAIAIRKECLRLYIFLKLSLQTIFLKWSGDDVAHCKCSLKGPANFNFMTGLADQADGRDSGKGCPKVNSRSVD